MYVFCTRPANISIQEIFNDDVCVEGKGNQWTAQFKSTALTLGRRFPLATIADMMPEQWKLRAIENTNAPSHKKPQLVDGFPDTMGCNSM